MHAWRVYQASGRATPNIAPSRMQFRRVLTLYFHARDLYSMGVISLQHLEKLRAPWTQWRRLRVP